MRATTSRSRRILGLGAAACVLTLAAPAGAFAFDRVKAVFFQEFDRTSYSVDQGEILTFGNEDPFLDHGIVSDDTDGAGAPLFSAPVVRTGSVRLIRGSVYLPTGFYPFHCPIHPGMTSELEVTTAGAPLPPDSVAPVAGLSPRVKNSKALTDTRRLKLVVNPAEPVDFSLTARAAGIQIARKDLTYVTPGPRVLIVKVPKAAARALKDRVAELADRGRRTLTLKLRATLSDLAGNPGSKKVNAKVKIALTKPAP